MLNHWQTVWACLAERACLRVLEGGCSVPVGVWSTLTEGTGEDPQQGARLKIVGTVTSLDGAEQVEAIVDEGVSNAAEAEGLGKILAGKLIDNGAGKILDEIKKDRATQQAKAGEAVDVENAAQPSRAQ